MGERLTILILSLMYCMASSTWNPFHKPSQAKRMNLSLSVREHRMMSGVQITPQCLNLPSPKDRETSKIPLTLPSLKKKSNLALFSLLRTCKWFQNSWQSMSLSVYQNKQCIDWQVIQYCMNNSLLVAQGFYCFLTTVTVISPFRQAIAAQDQNNMLMKSQWSFSTNLTVPPAFCILILSSYWK